jgi:hypothetical protein
MLGKFIVALESLFTLTEIKVLKTSIFYNFIQFKIFIESEGSLRFGRKEYC